MIRRPPISTLFPYPTLSRSPLGNRLLQMQPMASTRPDETHAVLAISHQAFGAGGSPYRLAGRTRTTRQLRTPVPNAWEVAWLVWNYVDSNHLNYFVLKPNGWEIGKRDPRYVVPGVNDGQKIIATGESVRSVLGQWHAFDIAVTGAQADISVNGVHVVRFTDTDAGAFTGGRVGLYGEDAACQWDAVTAPFTDSFDMEPVQPLVDGSQLTHWQGAYLGYGSGAIVAA